MRLVLRGLRRLEIEDKVLPKEKKGFTRLSVLYCAFCRTDAKMWNEGHRDLVFPRVLGHELVGKDSSGNIYIVWPGQSCGDCVHCNSGRENLCEDIKIMGFHFDGGFSEHVLAPTGSLIPVPASIPQYLACFAEPVGCALHALKGINLVRGDNIIIYGGGTMGLITALVASIRGANPVVIEKSQEKITKALPFLEQTEIRCEKETTASKFHASLNACPDPVAFAHCVVKLEKGGRLSFFSGLTKNQKLETNLINLVHYHELEISGSYGLTKKDMEQALKIIEKNPKAFESLIERIVPASQGPELPAQVLSGIPLKFILDMSEWRASPEQKIVSARPAHQKEKFLFESHGGDHSKVIQAIEPVDEDLRPRAQAKIDNKTKPLGALGKLEDLAVQLSIIQNNLKPSIERKFMFVFAADHGVVEEGVSAYPAEVTGQMVLNFLRGGAAINVLCRHYGIDIRVVDMGVNQEFEDHPLLIKKKVRHGTRNFTLEHAMTEDEAVTALKNGMDAFFSEHRAKKIDIVGLGDMGIGNTTAATAIICAVTGISPGEATGRGTGVDDKVLEHKIEIIEKSLLFHRPDPSDGFDILKKVGGFEIAGIAGAVLAGASQRAAVVLDGVISTAGGLIAYLINPDIKGYLFCGHRSVEPAQKAALAFMGVDPVVDLNMRLGEGTGAAIAINLLEAASKIVTEMASFDEAGVSKKI